MKRRAILSLATILLLLAACTPSSGGAGSQAPQSQPGSSQPASQPAGPSYNY